MTTTATKARALDDIAAEYRQALADQEAASEAYDEGQRALSSTLRLATDRVGNLRDELNAAAVGLTVDEQREKWMRNER